MPQFRKKPVVVEAMQFTGDNQFDICRWLEEKLRGPFRCSFHDGVIDIPTTEGVMTASPRDWIIIGVKGEVYPCKPDIFAATYEEVHRCKGNHPMFNCDQAGCY